MDTEFVEVFLKVRVPRGADMAAIRRQVERADGDISDVEFVDASVRTGQGDRRDVVILEDES